MQLKHKASMPMLQSFLCRQNLSLCLSTDLQFWLGLPLLLFSSWVVSLCSPIGYRPPGSSVHGIFQANTVEWVAISFSIVSLGKSMTIAVLHRRLLRLDLETRVGQDETTQGILLISGWRVGHLRVTGETFILIFWILLLKESGRKIWAAQTGFLLITPGMVGLWSSLALQFHYSLRCLGLGLSFV